MSHLIPLPAILILRLRTCPWKVYDRKPSFSSPLYLFILAVLLGQHDDFLNEYCDWLKAYLAGPDKVYNTDDDLRVHMRFAHGMKRWRGGKRDTNIYMM